MCLQDREKLENAKHLARESFRINNIFGDLVDIGFLDQYRNVADIYCATELTMTEHRGSKVNANVLAL